MSVQNDETDLLSRSENELNQYINQQSFNPDMFQLDRVESIGIPSQDHLVQAVHEELIQSRLIGVQNVSPQLFNIQVRANTNANKNDKKSPHSSPNVQILKSGITQTTFQQQSPQPYPKAKVKKAPLYDPSFETMKKQLKQMNLIKPSSPLKIRSQQEIESEGREQQRFHRNFVNNVIGKFNLYTNTKTFPASVISQHKNVVDQFKRNFSHNKGGSGYASEDDKDDKLIKFGASRKNQDIAPSTANDTNARSGKSHKKDVLEIIHKHAEKVRQRKLENQGSPMSERIRSRRLQSSLSDTNLIRHNKALPGMGRPLPSTMQAIKDKRQRLAFEEEVKGREIRQQFKNISVASVMEQIRANINQVGSDARVDAQTQQQIKQTVKIINKRILVPLSRHGGSDFHSRRKTLEQASDQGIDLVEMSEQNYRRAVDYARYNYEQRVLRFGSSAEDESYYQSLKSHKSVLLPQVRPLLTVLRKRERERKRLSKQRIQITRRMNKRGVRDEEMIEQEHQLIEWKKNQAKEKAKRARWQKQDLAKISIDVSQLIRNDFYSEDDEDMNVIMLKQDLKGVETDFKFQIERDPVKREERNARVAKARERLKLKKQFAEDNLNNENEQQAPSQQPKMLPEIPTIEIPVDSHQQEKQKEDSDQLLTSQRSQTLKQRFQKAITSKFPDLTSVLEMVRSKQFLYLRDVDKPPIIHEPPQKLKIQKLQDPQSNFLTIQQSANQVISDCASTQQDNEKTVSSALKPPIYKAPVQVNSNQLQFQSPRQSILDPRQQQSPQKRGRTADPSANRKALAQKKEAQPESFNTFWHVEKNTNDQNFAKENFNSRSSIQIQPNANISVQSRLRDKVFNQRRRILTAFQGDKVNDENSQVNTQTNTQTINLQSTETIGVNPQYWQKEQSQRLLSPRLQGNIHQPTSQKQEQNEQDASSPQLRSIIRNVQSANQLWIPRKDIGQRQIASGYQVFPHNVVYENAINSEDQDRTNRSQPRIFFAQSQHTTEREQQIMSQKTTERPDLQYEFQPSTQQLLLNSFSQLELPRVRNRITGITETSQSLRQMIFNTKISQIKEHQKIRAPLRVNVLRNKKQFYETVQTPASLYEKLQAAKKLGILIQPQLPSRINEPISTKSAQSVPYIGLFKMNERKESGVNNERRDDFILRGLTLKDVIQCPEKLPNRMRTAISLKNFVTQQDMKVYELLEKCEETVRIPWRYILKEHGE